MIILLNRSIKRVMISILHLKECLDFKIYAYSLFGEFIREDFQSDLCVDNVSRFLSYYFYHVVHIDHNVEIEFKSVNIVDKV